MVHCSSTVRPVVGARPVDGSWVREMASEREACEEESLDILRKVKQTTELGTSGGERLPKRC